MFTNLAIDWGPQIEGSHGQSAKTKVRISWLLFWEATSTLTLEIKRRFKCSFRCWKSWWYRNTHHQTNMSSQNSWPYPIHSNSLCELAYMPICLSRFVNQKCVFNCVCDLAFPILSRFDIPKSVKLFSSQSSSFLLGVGTGGSCPNSCSMGKMWPFRTTLVLTSRYMYLPQAIKQNNMAWETGSMS